MKIIRFVYESLGACWLVRWKRSSWVHFLIKLFKISPYGFCKKRAVGKYYLHLDPGDIHDSLYYFSAIAFSHEILLRKMLNAGDVVVDVGASVGHFSALAAKYVGEGGKVYSFEAALSPFDKLAKCVVGFPGGPIEIQNKAIWSASGELPFYVATNSGWSSLRQHPDPDKRTFDLKEQKQVSAITLDSIFQDKNIKQVRMLKLDVEGAEADVLIGGRDMLEANKVDSILMEYSTRGLEAFGKSGAEVHGMILNFGYSTVLEINSDRIRPFDVFPNFEEVITFDLFYVRSSLAEETRKMFFGNTKSN